MCLLHIIRNQKLFRPRHKHLTLTPEQNLTGGGGAVTSSHHCGTTATYWPLQGQATGLGPGLPHTRIVSFIIFNICKIKKVVSGEIKTSPICEDHWGIFAPRISEHDVSKHDLHEDPDFAKKYSLIWWENNTRTRNRFMFLQTFLTTARETECFETNDSHPWAPFPCPGPYCG